MTNTNSHQNTVRAHPAQPYTAIEQILPTESLVHAGYYTTGGKEARQPRTPALDVRHDISRSEARLPAQRTGEWTREPTQTHQDSLDKTVSRANARRFDSPTHFYTSGHTKRAAPIDPDRSQPVFMPLKRPLRGVGQDKAREKSARTASRQPARDTHVSRAPFTNNKVIRSQSVAGKQKLVQVTLWVDPDVKAHLERKAKQEGLTLSPAGAAFLRKAVQQDIDLQYSALLRPIIEDAITKQMGALATRLTWLLVRIAFDAGQTRSLVTNILGRQPGVTQPLLKTILEGSSRSAKANIMRRTPHITEIINSVEQWMLEESRGEK